MSACRRHSHASHCAQFLASLRDKLLPAGAREREALLALKREDCEARGEPFDGELRMWDLRFYQVRAACPGTARRAR